MIVLRTPRPVLRHVDDADAAFLLELMNEPGWLQFIGDRGVRTLDDARAYLRRAIVEPRERLGFGLHAVVPLSGGEPMGLCGLVKRDALPHPDLGFAFLERWSGRGFARDAAQAVMDDALARLRLPRVLAVTVPENARSLRLLEAIGFQREGLVRLAPDQPELLLLARDLAPSAP